MSFAVGAGHQGMSSSPTSTELDAPYSGPGASPTEWSRTSAALDDAEIFWLSTVRADGRPHVTPIIAVWADGALHFCTGSHEQKVRNLAANPNVVVTTGNNSWRGLDIVVDGPAVPVTDDTALKALAERYVAKYGEDWRFEVADGAFSHDQGAALVFAVTPTKAYAYDRDEPGGATRYRF